LSSRPLLNNNIDRGLFVDREAELQKLEQYVRGQSNALLTGERGIGKTSLLYALDQRLCAAGLTCAVVSLGDVETLPAALTHITVILARSSSSLEVVLPPTPRSGLIEPEREVETLRRTIEKATGTRGGTVALLIDNIDPLIAHSLFGRLRDTIWTIPATWVVTCSLRDLGAFLTPPADAFFEAQLRLQPFTIQDSHHALALRAPDLPPEIIEGIVSLADGRPRSVIQTAHAVLQEATRAPSETDGLTWALERACQVRAEQEGAVASLTRRARALWDDLVQNGPASASDELLMRRLGWSRPHIAKAFYELENAGLVMTYQTPSTTGRRPRRLFAPRTVIGATV